MVEKSTDLGLRYNLNVRTLHAGSALVTASASIWTALNVRQSVHAPPVRARASRFPGNFVLHGRTNGNTRRTDIQSELDVQLTSSWVHANCTELTWVTAPRRGHSVRTDRSLKAHSAGQREIRCRTHWATDHVTGQLSPWHPSENNHRGNLPSSWGQCLGLRLVC